MAEQIARALTCPLCCNEIFTNRRALKQHLLSLINNLWCPSCNTRCENILQLAKHLESDCCSTQESSVQVHNVKQDVIAETDTTTVKVENDYDVVNNDSKELQYTCNVCDTSFDNIEDHLEKYHEGEEVLLETEINNECDVVHDDVDEDENARDISDANTGDVNLKDNRDPPISEKYAIIKGTVKKITNQQLESANEVTEIHQCPECFLQFPELQYYYKHNCQPQMQLNQSKGLQSCICHYCKARFEAVDQLVEHLRTHVTTDVNSEGNEVKRTITMGVHTCEICNITFPTHKSLKLHCRMHTSSRHKEADSASTENANGDNEQDLRPTFYCNTCNQSYDKQFEGIHTSSHLEQEHHCTVCNKEFFTKENLQMHMKVHTNVKTFTCSYCKKAFANYDTLQGHINSQCQKRQYECQYCGRRFSRPHEAIKHERIHTGEKPHVCKICGKAFRVTYCLTLHMRTHSGVRPYKCKHCNKCFKSHSVYSHHLKTHTDDRKYKCPYCPKAFKTSVQLAGHKNCHTKPFTCTVCNRPFASLYYVRLHMEIHKRENNLKYSCGLCGAIYARLFALKDHMHSQHPEYKLKENEDDSYVEYVCEAENAANVLQNEDLGQNEQAVHKYAVEEYVSGTVEA